MAQVLEQLLGVVPAAVKVDPVSLPRERAGALRRQLVRLLVDEPTKAIIEFRRSDSEHVGQCIR